VPTYGWQALFYIGGIAPIVFALAAIFGLPESIKFMTLHEGGTAQGHSSRFSNAVESAVRYRG
jgi:AAHS family 4-hydroxybenzoate transporter-like MFS transporter